MRELVDLIQNTTIPYRKGAAVRVEDQGPLRVWIVDDAYFDRDDD